MEINAEEIMRITQKVLYEANGNHEPIEKSLAL